MAAPGALFQPVLNGSEIVLIDNGGSVLVQSTTEAIAATFGLGPSLINFTTVSATSSQNVTITTSTNFTAIHLTQTAAALTVTLPANPVQNQRASFTIDQSVTALSVTASTVNQTINARTALSASTASFGGYEWVYNVPDTTWYVSV